jgi:hypothetical protein
MDHHFHVHLAFTKGLIESFSLLDELFGREFKNNLCISNQISWIDDLEVPGHKLIRRAHITTTVPSVVEDNDVHPHILRVKLKPFVLVCQEFIVACVRVAKDHKVGVCVVNLYLLKWAVFDL